MRGRPLRTWLLWAIGLAVVAGISLTLADPALVVFALDPELAAVLVLGSLAFFRTGTMNVLQMCLAAILPRRRGRS
jgi:hypothetical protein